MDRSSFQIGVILTEEEKQALANLKKQGIQKGHFVGKAIREKLARDGILPAKKK
jgi:hypothetical protein